MDRVEAARRQRNHTVQASEIGMELQTVLQERINRNKDKFVKAIFNSADVELNELQIVLTGLEDFSLDFSFLKLGEWTFVYLPQTGSDGVIRLTLSEKESRTGILEDDNYRFLVNRLIDVALILKHNKYVDALFYEEPEMCLHPQLQQKMARVLCQLVNAGVQMNVTTHSDIILQHINNMLRLSARQDREEICRQLGYIDDDLLCPGKVKVYQLTASTAAKTKVEELSCGKNGFAIPTFNDALDRIMDEAYVIQE